MTAYITLDYELFMGSEVGTINNCLIKPMDALTKMLDKYQIKCNIFVDAAYLLRLYQLKDNKEVEEQFQLVTRHVSSLSEQGHAIQFHFHPQWLYSKYEKGWVMDFDHYKISDMPKEDIKTLIPQAIELLQSYSRTKLSAFRAGGYSFPNEPLFFDILREYEIHIDTSVLKGAKVRSKYQSYDYSTVPEVSPYNFDNDVCVKDPNGYFTEYPITTNTFIGYRYLFLKSRLTKRYKENDEHHDVKFGDGSPINIKRGKISCLVNNFIRLMLPISISATIDGVFSLYLEKLYQNTASLINNKTFVIIGHPKNFSEKSISIFESFIQNHSDLDFDVFN